MTHEVPLATHQLGQHTISMSSSCVQACVVKTNGFTGTRGCGTASADGDREALAALLRANRVSLVIHASRSALVSADSTMAQGGGCCARERGVTAASVTDCGRHSKRNLVARAATTQGTVITTNGRPRSRQATRTGSVCRSGAPQLLMPLPPLCQCWMTCQLHPRHHS